jgi:hypothetical protein
MAVPRWPDGHGRRQYVAMFRLLVLAVLASLVLAAPDAQAQLLVPPADDCPEETLEQPFAAWGDHAQYVLAPDGGFENGGAGWDMNGAVVAGNVLALSPGDWAKSPTFCVGLTYPTIRFFGRNTGSPLGVLAVAVVVKTSLGVTAEIPIGVAASASHGWAPSLPMPLLVNLLTATGGEARIALRFTALGPLSSWEIDDVYVDPYGKR